MKDFEEADKEVEQAVQMTLAVASEDPRFAEKDAPPLSEEFPEGSKIFFLGEHAYGVAAQVSSVTESTLSVILAVSHPVHSQDYTDHLHSSSHRIKPKMRSSKVLSRTAFRVNISPRSKYLIWSDYQAGRCQKSLPASWSSPPTIRSRISG